MKKFLITYEKMEGGESTETVCAVNREAAARNFKTFFNDVRFIIHMRKVDAYAEKR